MGKLRYSNLPKGEHRLDTWWHERHNKLSWHYILNCWHLPPEERAELHELLAIVAKSDEPYLTLLKSGSVGPLKGMTHRVRIAVGGLSWKKVGQFMLEGLTAVGNQFAPVIPPAPR